MAEATNPITTASNPRVGEDVGRAEIEALIRRHITIYHHNAVDYDLDPDSVRDCAEEILGKLVASTGSGEETKGATPMGSGHSRAEPSGLGATPECPSRGPFGDDEPAYESRRERRIASESGSEQWLSRRAHRRPSPRKEVIAHVRDDPSRDPAAAGSQPGTLSGGNMKCPLAEVRAPGGALAGEARRAETEGLGSRASDGEAGTPEATPKSSPSQTPVDPQMTVEEAREVLRPYGPTPEARAAYYRSLAKTDEVTAGEAISLIISAKRIEAALRTLQAGGEVRHG